MTVAGLNLDASEIVAAVLVCLYAGNRFNTPKEARSQTSQIQYFLSYIAYVLSCLVAFGVLTWAFAESPHTLDFLTYGHKPDMNGLNAALVAALVLTTLLPTVPALRDLDTALLRFFHRMGCIPYNADRWAQRIKEAELRILPQRLDEIREYIKNTKILPNSLAQMLQPDKYGDQARYIFTRNLALYVALSNLDGRPRFAEDYRSDIEAFEKKVAGFFAQSAGFLALTDQQPSRDAGSASEQVSNAYASYREIGLDVYDDIRKMLARVLLYSCRSEYYVSEQLRLIGFSVQCQPPVRIPHNLLALDLVAVAILFVAAGFLSGHISGSSHTVGRAFLVAFMVAVKQSAAAICAVLPKQSRVFAIRHSTADERPYLAYMTSGVLALTAALVLSVAFYLVCNAMTSPPMVTFVMQCRWSVLPTVLAVVLAFECDNYAGEREPVWLSFAESAALAAMMALSGLLVVTWLQQDAASLGAAQPHHSSFLLPALLSATMGALCGATIPRWYRRTLQSPACVSAPLRQHGRGIADGKPAISEQLGSGSTLWWESEVGSMDESVADGLMTTTAGEMVAGRVGSAGFIHSDQLGH
jgi:hypothetical protein